jgi:hypothetical protein
MGLKNSEYSLVRSVSGGIISEFYPQRLNQDTVIGNLKVAMRYGPVDLSVLHCAFKALDRAELEG